MLLKGRCLQHMVIWWSFITEMSVAMYKQSTSECVRFVNTLCVQLCTRNVNVKYARDFLHPELHLALHML